MNRRRFFFTAGAAAAALVVAPKAILAQPYVLTSEERAAQFWAEVDRIVDFIAQRRDEFERQQLERETRKRSLLERLLDADKKSRVEHGGEGTHLSHRSATHDWSHLHMVH